MTVTPLARGLSEAAFHDGARIWVPIAEAAGAPGAANGSRRKVVNWHKGVVKAIHRQAAGPPLLDVALQPAAPEAVSSPRAAAAATAPLPPIDDWKVARGVPASECCLQNERDDTVDDLVRSDFLHEPGILHTLQVRYGLDAIYTYSGGILIANNPHKRLKRLYGPRMMAQYKGVPLGELSPHVYAIAEQAYSSMVMDEQRQAILISGESGAGKTESAKMVMQASGGATLPGFPGSEAAQLGAGQYLAHRALPEKHAPSHGLARTTSGGAANGVLAAGESAPIEEQVLESNPLLEAFGNAKTSRNAGRVTGASISTYLLERSRVVSIKDPERSYHIFYQLCAGASEEQVDALGLQGGAPSFRYLSQASRRKAARALSSTPFAPLDPSRLLLPRLPTTPLQSSAYHLEDVDDAQEFRHTLDAMRIVDMVLRIVAGVLHLGNIEFADSASDEAVLANAPSAAELAAAAGLLGVAAGGLQAALTTRAIETRGERIVKVLDAEAGERRERSEAGRFVCWWCSLTQGGFSIAMPTLASVPPASPPEPGLPTPACSAPPCPPNLAVPAPTHPNAPAVESRDALAKTLYARLFDWLVAAINRKIGTFSSARGNGRSIGILDIYGFESFGVNSFEQLCINLANERLQQQFNAHVFKEEQEEYGREGISWSYIDFVDNQDVLDLLEGGGPGGGTSGVFPLIDEACRLPRASYQDLAHTLRTRLAGHPRFSAPRRQQYAFEDFVVAEHAALLGASTVPLIQELFDAEAAAAAGSAAADAIAAAAGSELPSPSKRLSSNGGPAGPGGTQRKSAFMLSSVGARFRRQLQGLMATLGQCQPHYIRCIKPNPQSQPGSLQPQYVLEQLRAGGVLEAVRIACAGFPTRKPMLQFAQRYALLLGAKDIASLPQTRRGFVDFYALSDQQVADIVRRVLSASRMEGWQLGRTRAFLRAGQLAQLEGSRGRRLAAAAVRIQAAFRGLHARRELRAVRSAAVRIQSAWRGHRARALAAELRRQAAATRVQTTWRMHRARRAFVRARQERAAVRLQAYVRMWQQRRRFQRETELGKRQAARAATEAAERAAAVAIQAAVLRRLAQKRVAVLRAEAAKLCALQAAVAHAEGERTGLQAALLEQQQRAERAEAEVAALKAQVERLSSKLEASQLQLAQATAAAAATATAATAAAQAEAAAAAQAALAAAQQRAAEAAAKELDLALGQRAAAEQRAEQLEKQVAEMAAASGSRQAELEGLAAAAVKREEEQAALWQQVQAVNKEYAAELEAKDAALAAAAAEAAAAQQRMQAEVDRLRQQMSAQVSALQEQLAAATSAAAAGQQGQETQLREASEKNLMLSSRVVSLMARGEKLEAELRSAQQREAALLAEVEAAKRAAAAGGLRSPRESARGAPRTLSQAIEAEAATAASAAAAACAAGLDPQHAAALVALQEAVVDERQPVVGVAGTPVHMPLASWLVSECLVQWSKSWPGLEIDVAADQIQGSILNAAASGGLATQAYWLSCSLAAGALLRVRVIGLPESGRLLAVGTALIAFTDLHVVLGDTVADRLPVNVAQLLSDEAKKHARRAQISPGKATPSGSPSQLPGMGGAEHHWRGVPPPAVRAVCWACLRYLDGQLLNALLLRRDCCSVSAAKALQAGLAELRQWVALSGDACCSAEEAEKAVERVTQAARYLVQGKDDLARRASRAVELAPVLGSTCSALEMQQVIRLTEHAHDDWLGDRNAGGQTVVLLEALRLLMASHQAHAAHAARAAGAGADGAKEDEDSEEDLLVDPLEAFRLNEQPAVRPLLYEAARWFVHPPAARPPAAGGTSSSGASPGSQGRQPNGSVSLAAALSGPALMDSIGQACRQASLPHAVAGHPHPNIGIFRTKIPQKSTCIASDTLMAAIWPKQAFVITLFVLIVAGILVTYGLGSLTNTFGVNKTPGFDLRLFWWYWALFISELLTLIYFVSANRFRRWKHSFVAVVAYLNLAFTPGIQAFLDAGGVLDRSDIKAAAAGGIIGVTANFVLLLLTAFYDVEGASPVPVADSSNTSSQVKTEA
eukprot:scaffold24.g2927.t1